MIEFKNVSFCYDGNGSGEKRAINDVSFRINDGDFVALTGKTGSGKTTLCKLICGLVKPTSGRISREGSISFAMQFPESQIFESTVIRDVMFGPMNRGLGANRAYGIAKRSLEDVGIDQELFERSPLSLSGGEKRRVALAGVLAMEADVLVLDEPSAGLDRRWHDELFALLDKLNSEGRTIVLVSHDMDDIAEHCKTLLLLEGGRVKDFGCACDVLARQDGLETRPMAFAKRLNLGGNGRSVTVNDLADLIQGSAGSR